MDPFKLLTGGGRFDRNRFSKEVEVFEKTNVNVLAEDLDFFGTKSKNKAVESSGKNKKRTSADIDNSPNKRIKQDPPKEEDYKAYLSSKRIKLTGLEAPQPILSAQEIESYVGQSTRSQVLLNNWKDLDYESTPVQSAVWPILLSDRDVLTVAPTGSGKTFAFLLPTLLLCKQLEAAPAEGKAIRPRIIIVEPTKELARQVLREAQRLTKGGDWKVEILGSEAASDKKKKTKKGKAKKEATENEQRVGNEKVVSGDIDILISTPLRLLFAIKELKVDASQVHHLILDELDKLFDLNFLPQTDEVISLCTNPSLRKGLFSATLPSSIEEAVQSILHSPIRVIVGNKEGASDLIDQQLRFVGTEDHKLATLRGMIKDGEFTPPVLVFVQSILRAKELSTSLLLDGIHVGSIHAEMSEEERTGIVEKFEKGEIWCLVATDLMGRGVDFKGVKLVVNYDFPQSSQSYIHRIGRTGRAGIRGKAITFFTKPDAPYLKTIANILHSSGCPIPEYMLNLSAPSKAKKRGLRLKPVGRKDISQSQGAGDKSMYSKDRKRLKGSRKRIMPGGQTGKSEDKDSVKGSAKKTKKQAVDIDE